MKTVKKIAKTERHFVRPIDHVVLSLPDLDKARQRFEGLGFNMAPVASHDFGTQNAIIPFSNGTFIEPLAIEDAELVRKYALKGNPFLIRDKAFRFRHGGLSGDQFIGGFSMIAFGGTNAKSDRKSFRKAGLHTGKIAKVRRPGLDVRLAFAMDERAADCTLFVCGRKNKTPNFDTQLTSHANGALRISSVVMVDENPSDFLQYLETVCNPIKVEENAWGLEIFLANAKLSLLTPQGLQSSYGIDVPASANREGLRAIAIEVSVISLGETAMMLAERGVEARQVGERVIVGDVPGQGAILAFVEDEA